MTMSEIEQAFRRLQGSGVELALAGPAAGWMRITTKDALEIPAQAKGILVARRLGVSVQTYRRCEPFVRAPYCRGINGNGQPCSSRVSPYPTLQGCHPSDTYCRYHRDQPDDQGMRIKANVLGAKGRGGMRLRGFGRNATERSERGTTGAFAADGTSIAPGVAARPWMCDGQD